MMIIRIQHVLDSLNLLIIHVDDVLVPCLGLHCALHCRVLTNILMHTLLFIMFAWLVEGVVSDLCVCV